MAHPLHSGGNASCPRDPNMATSDPQTLVHNTDTQVKAETLSQLRDSPPGGAVRAADQPGRLQLPVPPLHPAQATPPTRSFAANPAVTATGSSPWRPQTPRPSHLSGQSSSDCPPTLPKPLQGPPPFVTTPPRFQPRALYPAPSFSSSLGYAALAPSTGRIRPPPWSLGRLKLHPPPKKKPGELGRLHFLYFLLVVN